MDAEVLYICQSSAVKQQYLTVNIEKIVNEGELTINYFTLYYLPHRLGTVVSQDCVVLDGTGYAFSVGFFVVRLLN